jgi:hypothetical protein
LILSLLPGCIGSKCDEGSECMLSTSESAGSSGGTTSQPSTGEPTGTTGEPGTGTGTSTATTGEPGTSTTLDTVTGEPETTTSTSTGEPGTTTDHGTTGSVTGEPSKYEPACAPDDGPASEFKIGLAERLCSSDFPEDAPLFRIILFTGPPLAPGEYKLDGGNGFAWLDTGDGMPVSGQVGTLTVTEQTADGVIGTYDVTLEDSTNLAGEFDAIFCDSDVLCG